MPIAYVVQLILYLGSRQAFRSNAVPFYEQPIRGIICFVRANRSKALNTWGTAALIQIVICTPLGAPRAQYKLSRSVQKLRRLSLHDTNIAQIRNN
jgi:hypothetical protein